MLNANKPHAYGQIYVLGHVQNGGDYATNEKIACILLGPRVKNNKEQQKRKQTQLVFICRTVGPIAGYPF